MLILSLSFFSFDLLGKGRLKIHEGKGVIKVDPIANLQHLRNPRSRYKKIQDYLKDVELVFNHVLKTGKNLNRLEELVDSRFYLEQGTGHKVRPLHEAVTHSRLDLLQFLISLKFGVNERDSQGRTPFHLAVKARDEEVARVLLEKGADINARDKRGETPLTSAIFRKDTYFVSFLLEKGAPLEPHQSTGVSYLQQALISGNKDILNLILDKSLEQIAHKDELGNTAIHTAAFLGRRDFMEIIFERLEENNLSEHAHKLVNEKNNYDQTPLTSAIAAGNKEVAMYLVKEKGADPESIPQDLSRHMQNRKSIRDMEKFIFELKSESRRKRRPKPRRSN